MAKKHTIDTLSTDVQRLKASTNSRFSKLDQVLDEMRPQVSEMHDFIVDYKGFERGQGAVANDGTIKISKDVWALIIKLVALIGAVIGITQVNK